MTASPLIIAVAKPIVVPRQKKSYGRRYVLAKFVVHGCGCRTWCGILAFRRLWPYIFQDHWSCQVVLLAFHLLQELDYMSIGVHRSNASVSCCLNVAA